MNKKRGCSVTELIVVIAGSAILFCLTMPVLQQSRSDARLTKCKNRLRQIAIAAHNFHDANKRLPPGTLGLKYMPAAEDAPDWIWESFGAQNTSSLAMIMPFMELTKYYDRYDIRGFDLNKTLDEMVDGNGKPRFASNLKFLELTDQGVADAKLKDFVCPADSTINTMEPIENTILVSQPMDEGTNFYGEYMDDVLYVGFKTYRDFGYTNYLASGGVTGCTDVAADVSPFHKWTGMMSHRKPITLEAIANLDGTSNTIMYGETLGGIEDGERHTGHAWMFGGIGRSWGWYWHFGQMVGRQTGDAKWRYLGDTKNADHEMWGSAHESGVTFAFGDASVRTVVRKVDWVLLYAMSGTKDGVDVPPEDAGVFRPKEEKKTIADMKKIEELREEMDAIIDDSSLDEVQAMLKAMKKIRGTKKGSIPDSEDGKVPVDKPKRSSDEPGKNTAGKKSITKTPAKKVEKSVAKTARDVRSGKKDIAKMAREDALRLIALPEAGGVKLPVKEKPMKKWQSRPEQEEVKGLPESTDVFKRVAATPQDTSKLSKKQVLKLLNLDKKTKQILKVD